MLIWQVAEFSGVRIVTCEESTRISPCLFEKPR